MSGPAPDVLADLLVTASEHSADRLVTTDRLLRELVGPDAVNAAHEAWTGRLREGLYATADPPGHDVAAPPDVWDLTCALRASQPGRRGGRW